MRYGIERKTKLVILTKIKVKSMREDANEALKAIGEKYNVKMELGSCTYSDNEAIFQMKVNIISEDGKVITREWEDLLTLAELKNFDVDKEYTLNGKKVKLKGYNRRAKKWSYIIEHIEDGSTARVGDQWFDNTVMDSSCKSGSCGC